MRKISTIFFQVTIALIGFGAFAFLLWEPHIEGRNAHATAFEIYFNDPFLVYAYTASIFFFVALYQAFLLLGYVRKDKTYSPDAVRASHTIAHCALGIIGFIVPALAYLFIVRPGDDIAGGVAVGLFLVTLSAIVATIARMLAKKLQVTVSKK
jgi:hypothetical protein